jgi:hypothetical protein
MFSEPKSFDTCSARSKKMRTSDGHIKITLFYSDVSMPLVFDLMSMFSHLSGRCRLPITCRRFFDVEVRYQLFSILLDVGVFDVDIKLLSSICPMSN